MPFKIPSKAKVSFSIKHILEKLCQTSINQRINKEAFYAINFNHFSSIDALGLSYHYRQSDNNTIITQKKT